MIDVQPYIDKQEKQRIADEWWYYVEFAKVIKFVESIYPRSPTPRDRVNFWELSGRPVVVVERVTKTTTTVIPFEEYYKSITL